MKLSTKSTIFSAAFLAVAATTAFANELAVTEEIKPDTAIVEESIWRLDQPKYEFKHPMTVTCEEFLDTDQIYRPYVVAWLSGRSVGVLDITDPDEFVPVSVPQMATKCEEKPDMMVWELIEVK